MCCAPQVTRTLTLLSWTPLLLALSAASPHPYLVFFLVSPLAMLLFAALVHRVAPLRTSLREDLRVAGRDRVASRPYYRSEQESEARHGYTRIVRPVVSTVTTTITPTIKTTHATVTDEVFVVVAPEKRRSKTCILWTPGFGRYFSHTAAFDDFNRGQRPGDPDIDLLGLDLPRYGRAYVERGYDTPGNEFNSVAHPAPGSGHKWCRFYYGAYAGALDILVNELGYEEIYVMCNSTAGLTFQCFVEDVLRHELHSSKVYSKVRGAVFTAPFWYPSKRGEFPLSVLPVFVFNFLAYCFPNLIMDSDMEGHVSWFDTFFEELLQEQKEDQDAGRDTRCSMPAQDPWYNPVHNSPYYIEWLAMAAEAQRFIDSCAWTRGKNQAKAAAPLPALCLMNNVQDKNVCVRRCGELFNQLYPGMELNLIPDLNHEAMLSRKVPYAVALQSIRHFILSTRSRTR